ncbi:reverse transcriptase domain-containing protein [Tanacetum coccineum]
MACYLFQCTLAGQAVVRFDNIEKNNITGWQDLKDKFVMNFQPRKVYTGNYANLQFIKQIWDEPLIDFTKRFNDEASKIQESGMLERRIEEMGIDFPSRISMEYFTYHVLLGEDEAGVLDPTFLTEVLDDLQQPRHIISWY